jgi:hypothetical protein
MAETQTFIQEMHKCGLRFEGNWNELGTSFSSLGSIVASQSVHRQIIGEHYEALIFLLTS